MSTAQIKLPPKLVNVFTGEARYRGAYGGRGSAKTRNFAKMTAVKGYKLSSEGHSGIILCAREFMNSLEDSSFAEVKSAIESEPFLSEYYDVGDRYIRTKNKRISYSFVGLRHNLGSIKSKANILLAWIDEAEDVSESAWRVLIPTIRAPGSEIWLTWNPADANSATHKRFRETQSADSKIVEMNWRDNPWFPAELDKERLSDMSFRPETYEHVWEGAFFELTDAQIFKGKFRLEDFKVDASYGDPIYGMDFGFARDPTVVVEVYIKANTLYISRACGKIGLDLDETAEYVYSRLKGAEKYEIRADSARPESISYLKRHGMPRIKAVKKWQGSVEDGVEFIKSFDEVVIHSSLALTVGKEFRLYSLKIDQRTGDVLPVIVDAWNHYIDAIRYALTPMIKNNNGSGILVF